MKNHFTKAIACWILSLAVIPTAQSKYTSPFVTTLENGLKVIIKKTNKPKVAVGMIWYKVGSADEPGGITGISHTLEHMMFKGTPKYDFNAYSKLISQHGGQMNAFTSSDYTAYFANIQSSKIPLFLELEADRMSNLILEKTEFKKEIEVVKEERRLRTDNNPQSLLSERFLAMANLSSPYHHPVVGWMNDLQNMKIEDLKQWYKSWYVPNNATIVVVGDVEPKKLLAEIKKLFGDIPSKPLPTIKPQLSPQGLGKKELHLTPTLKTNIPMLLIGYGTPSIMTANVDWHPYALEVAAAVLSGGNSARLPKELVREKQSAIEASADYDLYNRFDNQFILFGAVHDTKELPRLKKDLFEQVSRLQNYLVSPAELKRIKAQVIAAKIFENDSIFGQAMQLGVLETIGVGYQAGPAYLEKIKAITPQQVQEAAKLYLVQENMTIGTLYPNTPPSPKAKAGKTS